VNAPSDVQAGAEFTVDIMLNLGGYSSAGHEVSVSFTPDLLVATNAVELGAPPYAENLTPGVRGIDNVTGVVDQFEAASLGAPIPPQAFVVGQITFQAGDVGGATIIGFFGIGGAVLDGSNPALGIDGVVFNSVSVNVIAAPTATPTAEPTATPTAAPTVTPPAEPTATPTVEPTATPTVEPTATPTVEPTATPTAEPTATPPAEPTATPTAEATATPTAEATATPTVEPTATPTAEPTATPTAEPTATPTAEATATPTAEATATPTAEATATPTATPTPAPENECQCVPHRVVPSGNLAVLKKTDSHGKGSTQTKKVGVVLKARELTRGACRPGKSTDTFSLQLHMVDDTGELILNDTRTGLTCDRRVGQQKFMATYKVENCAGATASDESSDKASDKSSNGKASNKGSKGKASGKRSKGTVTVTATTEDGELVASRTLKCNK
jgi:hypothetical protein